MDQGTRIDKWLWAVRIFKTRSLATEACRAGKVRCSGVAVKASREIRPGDICMVSSGPIVRTLKVRDPIQNRVNAKLAVNCYEDLTPPEEYEKLKMMRDMKQGIRPRGLGRPTKKERRELDDFSETL